MCVLLLVWRLLFVVGCLHWFVCLLLFVMCSCVLFVVDGCLSYVVCCWRLVGVCFLEACVFSIA